MYIEFFTHRLQWGEDRVDEQKRNRASPSTSTFLTGVRPPGGVPVMPGVHYYQQQSNGHHVNNWTTIGHLNSRHPSPGSEVIAVRTPPYHHHHHQIVNQQEDQVPETPI